MIEFSQKNCPEEDTAKELAPVFRFCAQSMHYPNRRWLTAEWFTGIYALLDALKAKEERRCIEQLAARDDLVEALQVEYTRLFINGSPHTVAPPWGSVYMEKTLHGKFSEEVYLYYREHGCDLSPESEFPDHIIHLLEYSAFAVDNGQELEPFLHRFFHPWFGEFSSRIRSGAQLSFYPIIISLIDFFTKEEKTYETDTA